MPDREKVPGSSPLDRHRWFGDGYVNYPPRPAGAHRADGLAGPPGRYLVIVALLAGTSSLPLVAAISAGPAVVGGTALGDTRPFIAPPSEGLVVVPLPPTPPAPPDDQPFVAGASVPTGWPDVPVAPGPDQYGWRSLGATGQGGAVSASGARIPQPTSSPSAQPTPDPESKATSKSATRPRPDTRSTSSPRSASSPRATQSPSPTSVPSRALSPEVRPASRLTWPLLPLSTPAASKAGTDARRRVRRRR